MEWAEEVRRRRRRGGRPARRRPGGLAGRVRGDPGALRLGQDELGTLNAAGLARGTLARLVATENLLLTLTGIPLGLVAGTYLARWFMSSYETEGYQWALRIDTGTTALVAGGVLVAATLSQVPALRTLRRIDIARIVRERAL